MPQPHKARLFSFIDRADLLAIFLCFGVFVFWLHIIINKFSHFGYYDWDLAIYANAMWSLTHGSFAGSLWGTNFLTNHAEYISLLLIPLYKLFPQSLTLVLLKILSMTIGGFILYLIAKARIGWTLALLITSLYFLFPANWFMLIFEFHFESLAIGFLFLIYYSLHIKKNYPIFVIACILASLCKENIAPVIFMFGFLSIFSADRSKRRFGMTAMAIGAGVFVCTMFVITPLLRYHAGLQTLSNPHLGMYWVSEEKLPFTKNIIANVHRAFPIIFSSWNAKYLQELLLPFALLPLISPQTLLLGLPLFLQAMLSNVYSLHTIHYHYAATVTPILFLATVEAIRLCGTYTRRIQVFACSVMTVTILINTVHHTPQFMARVHSWSDRLDTSRWTLLNKVPPDASIVATFEFLEKLANRPYVYALRNVWLNNNPFTLENSYHLPEVEYALIDWNCRWLWGDLLHSQHSQKYLSRLHHFYFSHPWKVEAIEEITLLSNKSDMLTTLVEISQKPFRSQSTPIRKINEWIDLLNLDIGEFSKEKKNVLPLELTWESRQKTNDFYALILSIKKDGKLIAKREHPIGYAFNATPLWEPGTYVKERYHLLLPTALGPGEYHLELWILNLSRREETVKSAGTFSFTIQPRR